ncbi:hypothetical protein FZEAL_5454 [Fusarium zealandicum]|uniref:Uncharacterized protein n=1 Tax=Fusarium zealandicum TaxID=1053134 RepID=A0A8H4UKH6_9HYPO|nr:hypothetical protein FZEAL_5454 [Fusarium zealandicum]
MSLPLPSAAELKRQLAQTKALNRRAAKPKSRKRKSAATGISRSTKRRKTVPAKPSPRSESESDDGIYIEPPLLSDFGPYGIPRDQYTWGPILATPKEEEFDEDETAPPPVFPDPYCNYERPAQRKPVVKRSSPAVKRSRPNAKRTNTAPVDKVVVKPTNQAKIDNKTDSNKKPLGLMSMPLEIREEIYRNILVSHKPVPVYDGWKRVYQRERPGLDISILLVNKLIYLEAIRTLYGGNSFLYRLRDAPDPSHQITGVRRMANNDDYIPDCEDEDEDEDDDFSLDRSHEPGTINIAKFARLFRYLIIQADHNRHTAETQQFMVDAIKVFAKCTRPTNIHTLSLVVSPEYKNSTFTFVNFFKANSTLTEALRGISCEMLRIRIYNKHLNGGNGQRSTLITLPLHHLRFVKQLKQQQLAREKRQLEGNGETRSRDLWAGDQQMARFRYRRLKKVNRALEILEHEVLEACRKHVQERVIKDGDGLEVKGHADDDDADDAFGHEWDGDLDDELDEGDDDSEYAED